VNETLVFRFPKDSDSEQQLLREIRLLPILAPSLPLAIPQYTYIAPASTFFPHTFVGYPLITGISLHQAPEATRRASWWRTAVGAFLTALHRIPVDAIAEVGLTGYSTAIAWRDACQSAHERYRRWVFPLLAPTQQHAINDYLRTVLADARMLSFTPVILHQDFGFHNLLVDVDLQLVTGVIDFGSCTVGDPALDVPSEVESHYGGVIDRGWHYRQDYYRRTAAFEDSAYLCTRTERDVSAMVARKVEAIAQIWPP
jgi:aminoglycoside phosphotransferase (APT) family kinase protein